MHLPTGPGGSCGPRHFSSGDGDGQRSHVLDVPESSTTVRLHDRDGNELRNELHSLGERHGWRLLLLLIANTTAQNYVLNIRVCLDTERVSVLVDLRQLVAQCSCSFFYGRVYPPMHRVMVAA